MSLITLEKTITIALSVKDRHASADWYQSMLGFDVIYHADEAGWSELQTKTDVEGMVKTATFYDPDGNALMLAQDLTNAN